MSERNGQKKRIVCLCVNCEAMYAAHEYTDGTILPIGRNGCSCEKPSFKKLDAASSDDEADPTGKTG